MNINKLKGKIVEHEMTIAELAEKMGCNRSTLFRKFRNPEFLTIGDAIKIKELIPLTDTEAYEIFLA